MKRCPYCAEEIQDSAVKCRYRGEWLKGDNSATTPSALSPEVVIAETSEHQPERPVPPQAADSLKPSTEASTGTAVRFVKKRHHRLGNWSFVLIPVSLLLVDFALVRSMAAS